MEDFSFPYKRLPFEQLETSDRTLLEDSLRATVKAYAPYSSFHVGAAVLLDDGRIITGNNQENAAFSMALCAERVALFTANAQYHECKIKAIAITATKDGEIYPVSPCGACRQVLSEYEHLHNHDIRILMRQPSEVIIVDKASSLLPFVFTRASMQ